MQSMDENAMQHSPRFVLYTNSVSPHQIPLLRRIHNQMDRGCCWYVFTQPMSSERQALGWDTANEEWIISKEKYPARVGEMLESAFVLMSTIRDCALFQRRVSKGLLTIYYSERWFKPRLGMLRLLLPSYFLMANKIVRLLRNSSSFYYFPIGKHAAKDMARMCGLLGGCVEYMFKSPELSFNRDPGGKIGQCEHRERNLLCLDKMRIWGYFVENGMMQRRQDLNPNCVRVLWVGRLLRLKRVDTIIKAIGALHVCGRNVQLDIVGAGPELRSLARLASSYGDAICFHPPVSIDEVRGLMRNHDIYILSSDGREGWGAVVSEAIEEGMDVVGTYESGASATLLRPDRLFHAGDWMRLKSILLSMLDAKTLRGCRNDTWNVDKAAEYLLSASMSGKV